MIYLVGLIRGGSDYIDLNTQNNILKSELHIHRYKMNVVGID